jgi:hypothetical protein
MKVISEILAYICEDEEGEGIPAFRGPNDVWIPLVGADIERMKSMRPFALGVASAQNKTIKVARFVQRVEIDVITPEQAQVELDAMHKALLEKMKEKTSEQA